MSYLPLAASVARGARVASSHGAGGGAEGSGAHGAESSRLGEGSAKHGSGIDDGVGEVVVWLWLAVSGANASPDVKSMAWTSGSSCLSYWAGPSSAAELCC